MTKRKTYTKEFKLEAVRLLESGDQDGVSLAQQLGVRRKYRGKSRPRFFCQWCARRILRHCFRV